MMGFIGVGLGVFLLPSRFRASGALLFTAIGTIYYYLHWVFGFNKGVLPPPRLPFYPLYFAIAGLIVWLAFYAIEKRNKS